MPTVKIGKEVSNNTLIQGQLYVLRSNYVAIYMGREKQGKWRYCFYLIMQLSIINDEVLHEPYQIQAINSVIDSLLENKMNLDYIESYEDFKVNGIRYYEYYNNIEKVTKWYLTNKLYYPAIANYEKQPLGYLTPYVLRPYSLYYTKTLEPVVYVRHDTFFYYYIRYKKGEWIETKLQQPLQLKSYNRLVYEGIEVEKELNYN